METISGIEIYPIISLIIFFAFFMGLLIWVVRADKKYISYVEKIPLENNNS